MSPTSDLPAQEEHRPLAMHSRAHCFISRITEATAHVYVSGYRQGVHFWIHSDGINDGGNTTWDCEDAFGVPRCKKYRISSPRSIARATVAGVGEMEAKQRCYQAIQLDPEFLGILIEGLRRDLRADRTTVGSALRRITAEVEVATGGEPLNVTVRPAVLSVHAPGSR